MKRLPGSLLLVFLLSARVEAAFEQASSVARSQAAGGAFVSIADDVSALFVNPAGIALSGRLAGSVEYAEPAGIPGARASRLSLAAASGKTSFAAGWYRLGKDGGTDDLLIAGVARRLFEAGETSFISIGANVALGLLGGSSQCLATEPCPRSDASGEGVTGDVGVLVRPLPVISFGFSTTNVFNVHPGDRDGNASWCRAQHWGVSYFWENRLVLSFAGETGEDGTTLHYGLSVKTAVPVELIAGFSDGHATGGMRWNGARCGAVIAFSSQEGGLVTWTGALELRMRAVTSGGGP